MTYGQTGSGKTFTMSGDSGNYQVTSQAFGRQPENALNDVCHYLRKNCLKAQDYGLQTFMASIRESCSGRLD